MHLHRQIRFAGLLTIIIALSLLLVPAAQAQSLGVTVSIPSINLNASVVEIGIKRFSNGDVSWDTANLDPNVGHLAGTAWLDAPGNIVLAGHSEVANRNPGIFFNLDQVNVGDNITFGERRYIVADKHLVGIEDLSVVYPTNDERLTLITCDTNSYNSKTGEYGKRLIIIAFPG